MSKILFKNARAIVTMDDEEHVWTNCDLLVGEGRILGLGNEAEWDASAAEIIRADNCLIFPGLINTHHHLYQSFTRNLPAVQRLELFPWLRYLYQLWTGLSAEWLYHAALCSLGELLKYGCTTCLDHHYVFPRASTEDLLAAEFQAAAELGIRLAACRGSMSLGESQGGLPPDCLTQELNTILDESAVAIERWHDPAPFSKRQILLAPCSPFSVDATLLKESAALARTKGVRLHTHLAETKDEERYCLSKLGQRPLAWLASLGWLGEDVSFAHGIWFNEAEMKLLAETKTSIAHCPSSNMKLSSGVLPLPLLNEYGVNVALAVDGSASNDGSSLLSEIRQAYLLQRLSWSERAPSGADILRLATRGGATLLGRSELGQLKCGAAADLFLLRCDTLECTAALEDPASFLATVSYHQPAELVLVAGEKVAARGQLLKINETQVQAEAAAVYRKLRRGFKLS